MKTVNTNQFTIIIFYLVISTKLFTMLPNLFSFANNDAIWSMILFSIIDFLLFILIIQIIKNNPDTTLIQFLHKYCGKFLGTIILIILFTFIIFKLLFISQETHSFFVEFLFEDMNMLAYILPYLFCIGYLAIKGEKTIAQTLEIFSVIILLGFIVSSVTALGYVSKETLAPFFQNGFMPILDGVYHSSFYFGNSFILLCFMGKIKIEKKYNLKTTLSVTLAFLFLILMAIVLYESYGQTVKYIDFAIADLPKYNPFVSDVGRLNWLSVVVCSIAIFIQSSIFLYASNQCCKNLLKIKKNIWATAINFIILTIFALLYRYSLPNMLDAINGIWSFVSIAIISVLTLICIIAIIIGGIKWKKH